MIRVIVVAVGLLVAGDVGAVEPPVWQVPVRIPAGIADTDGKVGYLVSKNGGIDAVDLADGKLLWTTDEARTPLLAQRDGLLAFGAEYNRVVLLDRTSGKVIRQSDLLEFPKDVRGPARSDPLTNWNFAAEIRARTD